MISVLLVDDHTAFRQPLAFVLNRDPEITVAGQAGSLAEARAHLEGVDVAVVDLDLGDGNGLELLPELRAANPHGQVLVLTASVSRTEEAQAVEAGAAGVLHKSASLEEIVGAIHCLGRGEAIMAPADVIELLRLASRQRDQDFQARARAEHLTPREHEVLRALAEGLSDREIAEGLSVSIETVRTHMVNILGKLGVNSRLQALVFAVRHGLVDIQ